MANRNRGDLAALVLDPPAKDLDCPRDLEPQHALEQLAQDALVLQPVPVAPVHRPEPVGHLQDVAATPLS